ncbi:MAG: hypothetical protein WBZ01_22145 [Terriglobales bacterium]|jgi:hypothetical protein
MSRKSQDQQADIAIDDNWVITIGMALLFAFIAFLLGWSIRNLLFDMVAYGVLHRVRNGWFDVLSYAMGAVYSFLFAYSFPAKPLKIAFSLLGAKYQVLVAMFYIHAGAGGQHSVAIAGAIASQIAYTIILFAIAQWFKTRLRPIPLENPGVSDS